MLTVLTAAVGLLMACLLVGAFIKAAKHGLAAEEWFAILVEVTTELCACLWLKPVIPILVIKILIGGFGLFCAFVLLAFTVMCFVDEQGPTKERENRKDQAENKEPCLSRLAAMSAFYYLCTMLLCGAWFFTL